MLLSVPSISRQVKGGRRALFGTLERERWPSWVFHGTRWTHQSAIIQPAGSSLSLLRQPQNNSTRESARSSAFTRNYAAVATTRIDFDSACFSTTTSSETTSSLDDDSEAFNESKNTQSESASATATTHAAKNAFPPPPASLFETKRTRTHEDWKELAEYFQQFSTHGPEKNNNDTTISSSLSSSRRLLADKEMFHRWISVVKYFANLKTVEGVYLGFATFHCLAERMRDYYEATELARNGFWEEGEDNISNDEDGAWTFGLTVKSTLHTLLISWKDLRVLQAKQPWIVSPSSSSSSSSLYDSNNNNSPDLVETTTKTKHHKHKASTPELPTLDDILCLVTEWRRLGVPTTLFTYNKLLLKALVDSGKKQSHRWRLPEECRSVLDHMLHELVAAPADLHRGYRGWGEWEHAVRPNEETFRWVLMGIAKSERSDAVEQAMQVLQDMNNLAEEGVIYCRANTEMYNALLEVLCDRQTESDLQNAEQIFREMDSGKIHSNIVPDHYSYRILFYGLANMLKQNRSRETCQRALDFLQNMELAEEQERILHKSNSQEECNEYNRWSPNLNTSMYSYLLRQLASVDRFEYADQLHEMLLKMQSKFNDNERFRPNFHLKRALLLLHARRGDTRKAEDMLLEMEKDSELDSETSVAPKAIHYEIVIECLLRRSALPAKAAAWVAHLVNLAKSQSTDEEKKKFLPNRQLVNHVLHRLAQRRHHETNEILPTAPREAEKLLRILREAEASVGPSFPLVDHDSYSAPIHSYAARSCDSGSPQRAERLLLEMQRRSEQGESFVAPTISHFTAVLNAWSKSGQQSALRNAKEIFEDAYNQYMAGNQHIGVPDVVFYGSIISACARFGDIKGIERFCDLMIEDFKRGNRKAQPNTFILNSILLSFLKNNAVEPDRASNLISRLGVELDERSRSLLQEMEAMRQNAN